MKYPLPAEPIQQAARKQINEKLLYLIDNDACAAYDISKADVFQAYTGRGGLHGLRRSDYNSYAAYSEAKKEAENGQIFTPAYLCQFVVDCLQIGVDDLVADLTCGMGTFFNFLPNEHNAYGCELDIDAYKVAAFLYPQAHLENKDIRRYAPGVQFDYILGNPPYNLRWWVKEGKTYLSQLYYCIKAAELLKPLGILAVIVPTSFLGDTFTDGTMIAEMERMFSFLGQISLPENIFRDMGAAHVPAKLQFWQKRSRAAMETCRYQTESLDLSNGFSTKHAERIYSEMIQPAQKRLKENRAQVLRELAQHKDTSEHFLYQVQKMLYQIKVHPRIRDSYASCMEYVRRFYTETQPDNMDYKEWCQKRLTEAKVLAYLRRVLKKQNARPGEDVIRLVKRDGCFAYKAYSAAARRRMCEDQRETLPIYQAVISGSTDQAPEYARLIRRKHRAYLNQSQKFSEMQQDTDIAVWLEDFQLWDQENCELICLNENQRHDLNLVLQKQYALLQWEQGSGKTLAGIAVGRYRMQRQHMYCTWVVSSAISIRNNWDGVLANYDLPYVFVEQLRDLERIRQGDFVLITTNALVKYERQIKHWMRIHGYKVNLVLDESDEITNPSSARTKAVLSCFRRCWAKLLTTGTSTRNNIVEFAPQLELLYNNSFNMISWAPYIYSAERDGDMMTKSNPYYGAPIPAYGKGYALFSASHLPEKITVFGVGQWTQDIYNAEVLRDILDETVITRSFREIVGREIRRLHQVPIPFTEAERTVCKRAIEEFNQIRENYFATTGNARKDAMMRLIQQITLLLRISAAPNTLMEYVGDLPGKLRKTTEMIARWDQEIVAVGVRHAVILNAYADAIRKAMPNRPLFLVTGATTSFAKRRALRKKLRESKNGILLCTQQSLPSSVNFEFVNKIIIPELHYNNAQMSQFYMRFVRYTSTEWKDIYFLTYEDSIEANLLQMVLAKERINLFMKGADTDLDEVYRKFGVNYNLQARLLSRETDEDGRMRIRWGQQQIA